jgi:2-hydroxycyclohexanecarboxyl-CoA dehydrogenase
MTKRRALVTGGSRGIGAAIVRRLAGQGIEVVFVDLDRECSEALAVETGAKAIMLDLCQTEAAIARIGELGHFDILVNNAGVDQHAVFTKTTIDLWRQMLAINLEATLATTFAVLPGMQERGWGRIINIGSEAGRLGSRGGSVYAAAKGGVIAFTKSIARENGRKGVTANVISPGPIDTPLLRSAVEQGGEKLLAAMKSATLVDRLGTPEEVAAAVTFLASEEAGFITGEVIGVSGGMAC